jgi:predicted CXXCH cytochrome family protein
MRLRLVAAAVLAVLISTLGWGQASVDVLGSHNMAPASGSPITGNLGSPCLYCHAPHSGINGTPGVAGTPLWSQKLSNVLTYQMYSSTTMVNKTNPSPPLGSNSTLCLSCHDGTVALGTLTPYGQVSMSGTLQNTPADLGTNLQATHPFNFVTPLQPTSSLWPSLSANPPSTQDTTGAVHLINGNVECGSCHNPHVQNIDSSSDFLVVDNSQSGLCLACHDAVPSGSGMGLGSTAVPAQSTRAALAGGAATTRASNPLGNWTNSIHATATNQIASQISPDTYALVSKRMLRASGLGPYTTMRKNGCLSCHSTHNTATRVLLRGPDDQTCLACHSGGQTVTPPAANIAAEMAAPKVSHVATSVASNNAHSAHESELLNHNRHAACVDCHNPHGTRQVGAAFPEAPGIRPSQSGVNGISATDGRSLVSPAVNQYENCLRCHGTSSGKNTNMTSYGYLPTRLVSGPDPLNILPEFALTSSSSHPVMHDRASAYPQPSLRANMLALDGVRTARGMGVRILCTDCHNSDDNREFGGTGPNGPHGSKFSHILERRYDISQAPLPGQPVTNLFVPSDLSPTGNYSLCAKCHDLNSIINNSSFSEHARHINDGFSCSTCHAAHGMGSQVANVSGERLVNFDTNVVAPNGQTPITYQRTTNSCTLTCHGHPHGSSATTSTARGLRR